MNNKLILFLIVAVVVSISGFIISQILFTSNQINQQNGEYLHYRKDYHDGKETKVFLIDSNQYYGVHEQSFNRSGVRGFYSIKKGESCVIINGTIKNDYNKDFYFSITADVYNSKEEKIEPILTINSPRPSFTVAYAKSGSRGFFEIRIKYDEKDIIRYELFIAFEPTEKPPT